MRQSQKQLQKTTSPHGIQSQRKTQVTGQSFSVKQGLQSSKVTSNQYNQKSSKLAQNSATQSTQKIKGATIDLQEQEMPSSQIDSDHDFSSTQFQTKSKVVAWEDQQIDHSNNYMGKLSSDKTASNQIIIDQKRSNTNANTNHFQYSSTNPKQSNSPSKDVQIQLKDEATPLEEDQMIHDGQGTATPQQDSVSQSRIEDPHNQDEQDDQNLDDKQKIKDHQVIVDSKYGDQKIDISEIHQSAADLQENGEDSLILQDKNNLITGGMDPSRPTHIQRNQIDVNQPLPSYSNKVNIGEFSVGNFKEFQLREDLSKLIEKYNKQFYGDSKKPAISGQLNQQNSRDAKYKDKMIINPVAVPKPGESSDNFAWMTLMTPYYNQLVKEFNSKYLENHILKQHFDYFLEMEQEQNLLTQEFQLLCKQERKLQEQLEIEQIENQNLEEKVDYMDRNLHEMHPEKYRELQDKLENLNGQLRGKDNVIDKLLNEIALIKNEKDDLQNDVLFKKQRIENLNFEFNTKEHEYQRLWEEEQSLKAEVRGDTSSARDFSRENEMLLREIAQVRDEIAQNQALYENSQLSIQEQRMRLKDYEDKLRYGNEVILQLEAENQQVELDIAQYKAYIEGQARAYNELKHNFSIANNTTASEGGLMMGQSNPIIEIPKMINPSHYFKPSVTVNRASINLLPSPSKALSQQTAPSNIKSYLSVKKTIIDLTSDIGREPRSAPRDQKVRFSVQDPNFENSFDGVSSSQGLRQTLPNQRLGNIHSQRRSDSVDARIDKRNFRGLLSEGNQNSGDDQVFASPDKTFTRSQNFTRSQLGEVQSSRGQSANRNFVDTMSGLLGGSVNEERQRILDNRASNPTLGLKKVDISNVGSYQGSPQKSILKDSFIRDSPPQNRYRDLPTDVSTDYDYQNAMNITGKNKQRNTINVNNKRFEEDNNFRLSTMSTQTPFKNKVMGSSRGSGASNTLDYNRNSQAHQYSAGNRPRQQQNQQKEEQKYRESTWQERMSQLPKNSAYKSSIMFGEDGIIAKEEPLSNRKNSTNNQQANNSYNQAQPFKMARDYDYDISVMNEDDPQAKTQVIKFKQQKLFELTDQRNLLQSQINHIPENAKQLNQRNKRQEIDSEIQKITKRISVLKYDIKKLNCKDDD